MPILTLLGNKIIVPLSKKPTIQTPAELLSFVVSFKLECYEDGRRGSNAVIDTFNAGIALELTATIRSIL